MTCVIKFVVDIGMWEIRNIFVSKFIANILSCNFGIINIKENFTRFSITKTVYLH